MPHYAEFHAWLVACDNLRRCEAWGFDTTAQTDLRLLRSTPSGRWADRGFHLVSMARQDACGGAEPGNWPSLFRTAPDD